MNNLVIKIREAMMAIGPSDLFSLINSDRASYYDALVWYNPETEKIDVEPIKHGDHPSPKDDRILLYRDDASEWYENGFEAHDLYSDDELLIIDKEFNGIPYKFIDSDKNNGGKLEERINRARRKHWEEKWQDILDFWPKLAVEKAFLKWLREEDKIIAEDDVYELWDEILNEYPVIIGNLEYSAAYILKEIDPIAYRCGFLDFIDDRYESLCDRGFDSNDYVECSYEEFNNLLEEFNHYKEREDE